MTGGQDRGEFEVDGDKFHDDVTAKYEPSAWLRHPIIRAGALVDKHFALDRTRKHIGGDLSYRILHKYAIMSRAAHLQDRFDLRNEAVSQLAFANFVAKGPSSFADRHTYFYRSYGILTRTGHDLFETGADFMSFGSSLLTLADAVAVALIPFTEGLSALAIPEITDAKLPLDTLNTGLSLTASSVQREYLAYKAVMTQDGVGDREEIVREIEQNNLDVASGTLSTLGNVLGAFEVGSKLKSFLSKMSEARRQGGFLARIKSWMSFAGKLIHIGTGTQFSGLVGKIVGWVKVAHSVYEWGKRIIDVISDFGKTLAGAWNVVKDVAGLAGYTAVTAATGAGHLAVAMGHKALDAGRGAAVSIGNAAHRAFGWAGAKIQAAEGVGKAILLGAEHFAGDTYGRVKTFLGAFIGFGSDPSASGGVSGAPIPLVAGRPDSRAGGSAVPILPQPTGGLTIISTADGWLSRMFGGQSGGFDSGFRGGGGDFGGGGASGSWVGDNGTVQRMASDDAESRPPIEAGLLRLALTSQSPGFEPGSDLRGRLAPYLGFDPGAARFHTGDVVAHAARFLNAEAFTIGKDVFFGDRKFDPRSGPGLGLIAHELTHVGQQTGAIGDRARFFSRTGGDEMEQEAQQTSLRVLANVAPGAGLQVAQCINQYLTDDSQGITLADQERLDRISVMALREAERALAQAGRSGGAAFDRLQVAVELDLDDLTDEDAADKWADAIVRCVLRTFSARADQKPAQRSPTWSPGAQDDDSEPPSHSRRIADPIQTIYQLSPDPTGGGGGTTQQQMEAALKLSPEGIAALQISQNLNVAFTWQPNGANQYRPETNVCYLNSSLPPMDVAAYFVHEMHHAQMHHLDPSHDDPTKGDESGFVSRMVQEEIDGTVLAIEAKIDAGAPAGALPGEPEYRSAYEYARKQAVANGKDAQTAASLGKARGKLMVSFLIRPTDGSWPRLAPNRFESYEMYYRREYREAHRPARP